MNEWWSLQLYLLIKQHMQPHTVEWDFYIDMLPDYNKQFKQFVLLAKSVLLPYYFA